jgi:PAS domain S-box-containing protein
MIRSQAHERKPEKRESMKSDKVDMDSFASYGSIFEKHRTKIHRLWGEELEGLEGDQGTDRLRQLKARRRRGQDLLSLLMKAMQQRSSLEKLTDDMAQLVRSNEYVGSDLVSETFALLRALDRVDPKTDIAQWQAARMNVQKAALQVCLAVLRNTSDVYEYSVETSARGFCQVDGQNRILSANTAMLGILGCEEVQGRSLGDFFKAQDKAFLETALSEKKTKDGHQKQIETNAAKANRERAFLGWSGTHPL